MARNLTQNDACALMELLAKEILGINSTISTVNLSNFASVGEQVLAVGTENVLNGLAILAGRRYASVRPRTGKLKLIDSMNTGIYTHRLIKEKVYAKYYKESGAFNTDLNTNLATGYDNTDNAGASTKSMWEQDLPMVLETNFAGSSTWQAVQTLPEFQLQQAMRDPSEFAKIMQAIMTAKQNDIERAKENWNRMAILQHIAMVYSNSQNMNGSVINLTTAYNEKFGLTGSDALTTEELLTTNLKEFMEFFVATYKTVSDRMTDETINYHDPKIKTVGGNTYAIPSQTPKSMQRLLMYGPIFNDIEAQVFPDMFNEQYLSIGQMEKVNFWQNVNDPTAIKVTPAVPGSNGTQTAGETVSIPFVLGMIYDKDALMVDYQLDDASTTPLEARKHYRNVWYTFARNIISDPTENAVIFIMEDPA